MTNGELQRLLAQLIFTTSDKGSKMIFNEFNYDESWLNRVLKEYIYLKVMVVGYLLYTAARDTKEAEYHFWGTVQNLSDMLDQWRGNDYMTYGCTSEELASRIHYYFQNSWGKDLYSLANPFTDCVDLVAITINPRFVNSLLKVTEDDLRTKLIKKTGSGKAAAGSGCLLPILAGILLLSVLTLL